jgi:hypothetical protein
VGGGAEGSATPPSDDDAANKPEHHAAADDCDWEADHEKTESCQILHVEPPTRRLCLPTYLASEAVPGRRHCTQALNSNWGSAVLTATELADVDPELSCIDLVEFALLPIVQLVEDRSGEPQHRGLGSVFMGEGVELLLDPRARADESFTSITKAASELVDPTRYDVRVVSHHVLHR